MSKPEEHYYIIGISCAIIIDFNNLIACIFIFTYDPYSFKYTEDFHHIRKKNNNLKNLFICLARG